MSISRKSSGFDAHLAVAAANKTQRGLDRFFHHFANVSGERDVAFARITGRFNVQHFAASRRVSQPGDNARLARFQFRFAHIFRRTEHFDDQLGRDGDVLNFSPRAHLRCDAATNSSDLTFKFTDAGFVCVIVNNRGGALPPAIRIALA